MTDMTDEWRRMTAITPSARYPKGSRVTVLTQYMGSGRYACSGNEGEWYVCGPCGPADLFLSRDPDCEEWGVIVHVQSIEGSPESQWRSEAHRTLAASLATLRETRGAYGDPDNGG
jgi:hypothetical protein